MKKAKKADEDVEAMALPLPNLPQHLLVEILSKVLVKSLLRFKCVSKAWHSLISNPNFIKIHLNQSLKKSSSIQTHHNILFISKPFSPYGIYTASLRSGSGNNANDIVVRKIDFLFQSSPEYQIRRCQIIGSCNGLICMEVESFFSNSRKLKRNVYVFNLSTRECRHIADCYYLPGRIVGFGYDHGHDDYKLVSISSYEVSVHSMRIGSWREVQDFPNYDFSVFPDGTHLNGAIHWLRSKNPHNLDFSQWTYEIAAFSLVDEKLWMIPLPSTTTSSPKFHESIKLGVFEGCLCMLPCCDGALWIMKEYGVEQSWTRIDIKVPIVSDVLALLRNEALIDYTKSVYTKEGMIVMQPSVLIVSFHPS